MAQRTTRKNNPFIKAAVLLIALIIAFVIYNRITTSNMIQQLLFAFDHLGDKYSDIVEFTGEEKDSVNKAIAGYWVYHSDTSGPLVIDDRMELKDNGYIWQVEQTRYRLPSGKEKKLTHAVHAFLHPSSRGVNDSTVINCVVRMLNQVWIDDGDTCEIRKYINEEGIMLNFMDRVKNIYTDGTKFEMNNREYSAFNNPDPSDFFPPGIIEFVYNLSSTADISNKKMYSVKKGEITLKKQPSFQGEARGKLVKECSGNATLKDYLCKAIADDLQQASVTERTMNEIMVLIKEYYTPVSLRAVLDAIMFDEKVKFPHAKFSFDLTWKGAVENIVIQIPGNAINRKWQEKKMAQEMSKWKFQPLEKEAPPFSVSFTEALR